MIAIVILNFNSFEDTISLVESLQPQTVAEQLQIVVVDNASPNDSYINLKPLEKKYSNVDVLQTSENLGYAKGNNVALKYLEKNIQPKYVAILNNDVVLENDCLEKLITKYEQLPCPGVIAPIQVDLNGVKQKSYPLNTFWDDCLSMFYITKIFNKRRAKNFKDDTGLECMKVDLIPGSFMFIDFNKFKVIGFFYPKTFLYVEERFITKKVQSKKWQNYIVLDQTYIHAHSKTIDTLHNKVSKYKMQYQGWLEYTRKHRKFSSLKVLLLKTLMVLSIMEIKLVLTFKNLSR